MGGVPGNVPLYYEVEACNAANYEYFDSWQELEEKEKAFIVAQFYLKGLVESHKSDESMKQASKKKKGKK